MDKKQTCPLCGDKTNDLGTYNYKYLDIHLEPFIIMAVKCCPWCRLRVNTFWKSFTDTIVAGIVSYKRELKNWK